MKYHDLDDIDLWELLLKEDSEALKVVYYRNYDLLLNYGYKICWNEELVKDCIHDIILKIFGNKNLSTVNQIRPYLLRALRNSITEELTKRNKISNVEFDLLPLLNLTDSSSTNTSVEEDDDELRKNKKLKSAFSKLNENQRQIIYLRYVKELSFKEVADLLEIKVQSAMNLSSRSILKLRNLLSS